MTSTSCSPLRRAAAALAVLSIAAGCGSSDDSAESDAVDVLDDLSDAVDSDADANGAENPGGAELPGRLVVSGAVEDTLDTSDDAVVFRPGAFCQAGALGVSAKTDRDGATEFDLVFDEVDLDAARGGAVTDVQLLAYDFESGDFDPVIYSGLATVQVTEQDNSSRRLSYTVDGELDGADAGTVSVDFEWTIEITCA